MMGNAMRKPLFVAFLIGMLFGGFALAGTSQLATVKAATSVTGIIYSDTTWTKANSPYNMTGPTAIAKGATLTIEPGAVVNFNTYTLEVNGTFRAIGTSAEPINLDGDWQGGPFINDRNGILTFTSESNSWDDQTGTGCIIENVNAISLSVFIHDTTVKLNNNVFSGFHELHGLWVYGGNSVISNNLITDGAVGVDDGSPVFITNTLMGETLWLQGGSPIIENNLFYGEHSGIDVSDGSNVRVVNNIIAKCSGFSTSLRGNVTFEHNLVLYCSEGLTLYGHNENIIVQNNTIAFNEFGIRSPSPSAKIIFNNLENNTQCNLSLGYSSNLDASYNWWGTTDVSAISQTIVDYKDDYNLGNVTFIPFLDAPNPQAPLISSFVEPSPSPSPSPSPTATSSPAPTSTPTPTPSQEPQQALQFEAIVGVAIVVAVIGAGLGLLIYLIKRK
jgi:hypothetical protein